MQILFRDEFFVVVNKPRDMLVHRSDIDRRAATSAMQQTRDLLGGWVYPVHRLDRPTAGALMFALSPEAARRISAAFARGEVTKTYLAVVRGHASAEDVIRYPLKERLDRMTDGRARSDKSPQDAVTAYRRLATVELPVAVGRYASARYSLLQVLPRTGRRHQIRRHMKHIFHPVIGDTSHGDGRHNRLFRDRFDNRRLLLAAAGLCWRHPYTGRATAVSAPLDADFQGIVRRLGWAALFSHDGLFDAGPDDEQCYRAMAI
jgi:tRNA pseudouridine65 synthase